jgi:hypothetical protein
MHPVANVAITNVTWTPSDSDPQEVGLEAEVWTLSANRHIPAATGTAFASNSSLGCSRRFGPPIKGVKVMWSALALRLDGADDEGPATNGTQTGLTALSRMHQLKAGTTYSFVVSVADNLLTSNEADPTPSAMALADAADPATVNTAAAQWWGNFWSASAVQLPTQPNVSTLWVGAQYTTACMTASPALMEMTKGMLPPPGLYGPWASGDFCFWVRRFSLPEVARFSLPEPEPHTSTHHCSYITSSSESVGSSHEGSSRMPSVWLPCVFCLFVHSQFHFLNLSSVCL